MEQVNMKEYEEKLAGIRKNVAEMRDKAVSAKTIQEQSEKQMRTLVASIVDTINGDEKKAQAKAYGDSFLENLTDEGAADLFFRFLEEYVESQEQFAMQEIASISEQIEKWGGIINQEV